MHPNRHKRHFLVSRLSRARSTARDSGQTGSGRVGRGWYSIASRCQVTSVRQIRASTTLYRCARLTLGSMTYLSQESRRGISSLGVKLGRWFKSLASLFRGCEPPMLLVLNLPPLLAECSLEYSLPAGPESETRRSVSQRKSRIRDRASSARNRRRRGTGKSVLADSAPAPIVTRATEFSRIKLSG